MNQADKFNGSVDLLARTMRTVVSEAVHEGIKPVREDLKDMKAQFAEHRKDVSKDVRKELARR